MPLQSLLSLWTDECIRLLPPELPKSIIEAFDRAGSAATRDVVAVYSNVGGMEGMDDGFLRVWSLKQVEEHSNDRSSFGLVFADHLANSRVYRL